MQNSPFRSIFGEKISDALAPVHGISVSQKQSGQLFEGYNSRIIFKLYNYCVWRCRKAIRISKCPVGYFVWSKICVYTCSSITVKCFFPLDCWLESIFVKILLHFFQAQLVFATLNPSLLSQDYYIHISPIYVAALCDSLTISSLFHYWAEIFEPLYVSVLMYFTLFKIISNLISNS